MSGSELKNDHKFLVYGCLTIVFNCRYGRVLYISLSLAPSIDVCVRDREREKVRGECVGRCETISPARWDQLFSRVTTPQTKSLYHWTRLFQDSSCRAVCSYHSYGKHFT